MANLGTLYATIGVDTRGLKGAERKVKRSTNAMGDMFMKLGKTMAFGYIIKASMDIFVAEIGRGLQAVESFNISVASMSGFIATFSQSTKDGDIVKGFQDANKYAQALIPRLEILDAKTVATGRDLTIMAETMAMNGVVLDINNKKQEDAFVNIANALKLVTQGQNSEIQFRQEINALLMGQMRMTDRLPKVLKAIDPNLKEHIKLWREQGTVIENVGELLESFGQATDLITQTWAAVGTTMQTIHNRILRGGMRPMYEDLINLAKKFNSTLMDTDGNLTDISKTIVGGIAAGWVVAREKLKNFWTLMKALVPLGKLLVMAFDGIGMILVTFAPMINRVNAFLEAMFLTISAGLQFVKAAFTNGDATGAWADWDKAGVAGGKAFAGGLLDEIETAYSKYDAAKRLGQQINVEQSQVPELANYRSIAAVEKVMAADTKALDKRIKAHEKFYGQLNKAMEDHYKKEYSLIQENNELLKQRLEIRQSTESMVTGLKEAMGLEDAWDMTGFEEFQRAQGDLNRQLEGANRLVGKDKVDALEEYKNKVFDIATAFNEGVDLKGQEWLSGWEIYEDAIKSIEAAYTTQKTEQDAMAAAQVVAAEANKIWGEQLIQTAEEASTELERLRGIADQLDAQIADMDSFIKLEVDDQATHRIIGIKLEIDRLRDLAGKPIVITTVHNEVFSNSQKVSSPPDIFGGGPIATLGEYAMGTNFVPADGPYDLHRGEAVVPADQNRRGGGGSFGDINITVEGANGNIDWRREVRDKIKPELDRL